METIILILIALGYLSSPQQYTQSYIITHETQIDRATEIYNNHLYEEAQNGGVIVDDDVNP